ncbi:MAG: efflux RND transporter permease subunit [Rhodospirillales bacterium]|jgi:multidrug efflux pump|nr:MFS transporter [Rhodospirillaceae bacterium]MDP6429355.1 efflux RND transporter permease subunit [Rhodospirillales bacterium]MDP6644781.1 efflux RND transporter permease subunit [Rhodospirillales bacterium]MDP6843181.1 efflux RND transporter permease subunit [Rhodospirillales bacterium]
MKLALIDAAIGRARTVVSALILILISGTVAYVEIPKESDPDINIPIIYVKAKLDGISPTDAERLIARPIEQEMRTIEGVKEMKSNGYEGGANVILEFEAGFDADKALDDVREKLDRAKPELPAETEEPTVNEVNFSLFPVLTVILSGDLPVRPLLRLANDLQDAIEGIPSVLKAEIAGDRDDMVEVVIDPAKLESYGISAGNVTQVMSANNLLIAAGAQDTGRGRFSVRVPGVFENVEDIMNMPIVVAGDRTVRAGDVADVRATFKDPKGFARVAGKNAIALEVSKRTGENIIETIAEIREVVEQERVAWPLTLRQAVHVSYSQDKSDDIRTVLADLQNNVISAILLVMIVIVAFLGLRTAGLVGISIPGSFLIAILTLASLGMTLNIVVLYSLILAVGMLVDGAIVVTEYADRKMAEGEPRSRAYAAAAKRMAWPIIASTATTLAAFLPLLFWPGVVGEFMKFLPVTLIVTLSASLLMALIFVPTLGALFGKPGAVDPKSLRAIAAGESGNIDDAGGFTGLYVRVLRGALRHPGKVVLAAFAMLIGVQWFYAANGNGIEFFPEIEPDNAKIQVRARGNLSVHEKDALMRQVESRILDMKEFETIYTRTGRQETSQEAEDIVGTIALEFIDWQLRAPAKQIFAEIRNRTSDLVGIHIDPREEEHGPPVGKPVQLQITARDPGVLLSEVARIAAKLHSMPDLLNVEDTRPLPGITWELTVDRAQAAKFGADVRAIGKAVQLVTAGIKVDEFRPDQSDDEVEIRVRYPVDYRTIKQLDRIRVSTDAGMVPLSNFVHRQAEQKIGTITRVDGKRAYWVKADVRPGVLVDNKVREIAAWLKTANIDPRVDVTFKGEDEEQEKAKAFLSKAFTVALFIMAIILVTQFNSFYSALLILSAVIMSTIGVLIGLLLIDQPFGIVMSGVGVIALAGIVVNNNIVLIDTFDHLKKQYADPVEAILRTGVQRMRPVLLTSATTILGLMPMVLGVNIDFVTREVTIGAPSTQWWTQLSAAIVFGLGFATILTLLVTPASLMVRANVQAWRRSLADKQPARAEPAAE